ncbi:MAG: DUF488 domain-containing protein [Sporocytophaga sp.]|nr:DUF488 domain-containing protein [Sporocytophaga sp.]
MALLEVFDNKLEKISLQKLLMLLSKQQQKPEFHFVPYKYGCFSFQANADLTTMVKYNQVIAEGSNWVKIDKEKYLHQLKEKDRQALRNIKYQYGNKSADELIKHTYTKFPYFAVNSTIAKERLSPEEYQKVLDSRPKSDEIILFTIGYEGISLEEYINKLILNDIKILCDVRKNPISMKYGFSKSQLQNACEGVGISYNHFPDLGITSDKRQELNTQSDYDKLFKIYNSEVLSTTRNIQNKLLELLEKEGRIALTCFEANICQCHRKHLAEAISEHPKFKYQLKHI